MKQILADITPMGSNNLFVTHYWPDKQTDPPLHYHEDYMLCLTLHVRGQRIMDDAVEDFTEKDLVPSIPEPRTVSSATRRMPTPKGT